MNEKGGDTIRNLKNLVKGSWMLQLLLAAWGMIIPVISIPTLAGASMPNSYGLLWVGFYSCIAAILFSRKKLLAVILVLLNAAFLTLWLFFSLMGGVQGLLATAVNMILPIIPFQWLYSTAFVLLPPEQFPPV